MALTYRVVGDTTQQAVFGGPNLFQGRVAEITLGAAADYVNGTGIPLSAAQAGLATIFHGFGYVKSATGVVRGILALYDTTLAAPGFRFLATGAANQAAFAEIATAGGGLAANDVLVAIVFGQ